METQKIYLDNAATTKMYEEAFKAMVPFLTNEYGNPSSVHSLGKESKKYLEENRRKVSELLGVKETEIYFTSGATEANNWAIKGGVQANSQRGKHIITTTIEHHAVLHVFEELAKEGYEVTYLPVDCNGLISIEDLKESLREDTIFVSIMYANNEIGTIQPIKEAYELVKENNSNTLFHTDAVQIIGKEKVDVRKLGVDLLSVSGHKFHGPKGVGFLYIKKGVKIPNLLLGGAQERKKRPGTENISGIAGLAKALEISLTDVVVKGEKVKALRDYMVSEVLNKIPYVFLNGDKEKRLNGNANLTFQFIEGESMLLALDMYGICASSGSACTSGSLDPSHVLLGIGLPHESAHGSLRLTLSEFTTKEEIDYLLQVLPSIIERLRSMSPLYEDFLKEDKKNGN